MRDAIVPGRNRTRPRAGQVLGELLLTAGVISLLFVIYEAFWTNIVTGRLQDRLNANLEQSWGAVVVETQSQWMTYRLLPLDSASPERRAAAARCLSPEQTDRVSDGDYGHLQGRYIPLPGDVDVVNPMPRALWIAPDPGLEHMLTLTTCNPLFSNAERMIVHAMQVDAIPKSSGVMPTALREH